MDMLVDCLARDDELRHIFTQKAEIAAMLATEGALARATAAAGLIAEDAAARIFECCQCFEPDLAAIAAGMVRDGVAVPELVRQLRAAVGPCDAAAVHFGATSQDIIDTALMLQIKKILLVLGPRLERLICHLENLQAQYGTVRQMAHTRMQVALAFTAGDRMESWLKPLKALEGRLVHISEKVLAVQLGGPVGNAAAFGSKAAAVSASMSAQLGLGTGGTWQVDRTRIADLGQFFSLLTGTTGKIGQDIALMAQNEVGAIRLAGGGSSSSMAHKHNPVTAEVLVALARFNAGLQGTLQQAMVHEYERSGAAWTLEWLVLPKMVMTAGTALLKARELLTGAVFIASEA